MQALRIGLLLSIVFAVLFGKAAPSRAENWPQFRGPTGFGTTGERNLPIIWGGENEKNVAWKTPLVGQGHASPIVWGDRVFVYAARWAEAVRRREEVIPEHHVLCYAAGDGKLLWDTLVPPGPWLRTDFRSGPGGGYACPTPTTDGRLVYCAFGSSVLAAIDFQGRIVWRKQIVPYTFDVTLGSSPILYRDTLILLCAMAKPSDSGGAGGPTIRSRRSTAAGCSISIAAAAALAWRSIPRARPTSRIRTSVGRSIRSPRESARHWSSATTSTGSTRRAF